MIRKDNTPCEGAGPSAELREKAETILRLRSRLPSMEGIYFRRSTGRFFRCAVKYSTLTRYAVPEDELPADAADEIAAKRARPSVAFRSPSGRQSQEISAYFRLLATLWQTRTEAGWEAIDAMDASASELTMSEVAPRMGITRQALSQRLQAAEWKVEREAIPLLERLLEEADRGSSSRR